MRNCKLPDGGNSQRDLIAFDVRDGLAIRCGDFDGLAFRIDDPKFQATVFQADGFFIGDLGHRVRGREHFDDELWNAVEVIVRIDRVVAPFGHIGDICTS